MGSCPRCGEPTRRSLYAMDRVAHWQECIPCDLLLGGHNGEPIAQQRSTGLSIRPYPSRRWFVPPVPATTEEASDEARDVAGS